MKLSCSELFLCTAKAAFCKAKLRNGLLKAGLKLTRRQSAGTLEAESFSRCSHSEAACRCAVDKLLSRTAEAAASGLWARCFCFALLSSYGLKLPSCLASSSLRCNGMLPSPHCKLSKLPSILPEGSPLKLLPVLLLRRFLAKLVSGAC